MTKGQIASISCVWSIEPNGANFRHRMMRIQIARARRRSVDATATIRHCSIYGSKNKVVN